MVISLIACYWLNKAGLSAVEELMDMTNAFQCTNWAAQETTLSEPLRSKDDELYSKRYRLGSACLLECDALDFSPTAGTSTGDPGSVAIFARSLKRPVARWGMRLDSATRAAVSS